MAGEAPAHLGRQEVLGRPVGLGDDVDLPLVGHLVLPSQLAHQDPARPPGHLDRPPQHVPHGVTHRLSGDWLS